MWGGGGFLPLALQSVNINSMNSASVCVWGGEPSQLVVSSTFLHTTGSPYVPAEETRVRMEGWMMEERGRDRAREG